MKNKLLTILYIIIAFLIGFIYGAKFEHDKQQKAILNNTN